jgi:hypothetical protein
MPVRRAAEISRIDEFVVGASGGTRRIRAAVLAWLLAIACLLLLGGGSAFANKTSPKAGVVAQTVVVQPRQFEVVTDTCSPSYPHPVGPDFGYVKGASTPGSVALTASYPRGKRGWLIAVENMSDQTQTVVFGIVCVRADARFAYPRTRNTVAGPGGYSVGLSNCPRSAPHPIDDYFGTQSAADTGLLLLAAAYPFSSGEAGGFVTGVRNTASNALLFFAGSVCTSLPIATSYIRETVGAGKTDGATIRCLRQTPVAVSGTFYPLPPRRINPDDGKILMAFSFLAARNTWAAGVTSLTAHVVKFAVGTVCLGT